MEDVRIQIRLKLKTFSIGLNFFHKTLSLRPRNQNIQSKMCNIELNLWRPLHLKLIRVFSYASFPGYRLIFCFQVFHFFWGFVSHFSNCPIQRFYDVIPNLNVVRRSVWRFLCSCDLIFCFLVFNYMYEFGDIAQSVGKSSRRNILWSPCVETRILLLYFRYPSRITL